MDLAAIWTLMLMLNWLMIVSFSLTRFSLDRLKLTRVELDRNLPSLFDLYLSLMKFITFCNADSLPKSDSVHSLAASKMISDSGDRPVADEEKVKNLVEFSARHYKLYHFLLNFHQKQGFCYPGKKPWLGSPY